MSDSSKDSDSSQVLRVENLSFGYPPQENLFSNLGFCIRKGEILAILGENGCGKTTLLDLLLGFKKPGTGVVQKPPFCGFVPQSFDVGFEYTVEQIVLMGRAAQIGTFSSPKDSDIQISLKALERLNLIHLKDRVFARLSGGQRQMVLIARALATESDLLIFDEPASALDIHNQNTLLSLLESLKEEGKAVIFTTHLPDQAGAVSDQSLLMIKGAPLLGPTGQILTAQNLEKLFSIPFLEVLSQYSGKKIKNFVPVYQAALK